MKKFNLFALVLCFLLTGSTCYGTDPVEKFFNQLAIGFGSVILAIDAQVKKDQALARAKFVEQHQKKIEIFFNPVLPKGFDFSYKNVSSSFTCQELYMQMDGDFLKQTGAPSFEARIKRNLSSLQLVALVSHSVVFGDNFSQKNDFELEITADRIILDCITQMRSKSTLAAYLKIASQDSSERVSWDAMEEGDLEKLEKCFVRVMKHLCHRILTKKFGDYDLIQRIEHYFNEGSIPQAIIDQGIIEKQARVELTKGS